MIKNILIIGMLFCALSFFVAGNSKAGNSNSFSKFESAYQHDMDIVRLNDIKEIGSYIEEYKIKTGKYPLVGAVPVPLYVWISTKEQQETIKNSKPPPYKHAVVSVKALIAELEKELGRKIIMPFDPQRKPSGRQNFYSYLVKGGTYNLAVHLYHAYPFASKIGDNWYKVEVSNNPNLKIPIWDYEVLMQDPRFLTAIAEPMTKPGYVDKLRAALRENGVF